MRGSVSCDGNSEFRPDELTLDADCSVVFGKDLGSAFCVEFGADKDVSPIRCC